MTRAFCRTVLILVASSIANVAPAQPQSADPKLMEQEIGAAEEQRRQAILRNDINALERLLAPEQTSITSLNAGKVTTRDRERSVNQRETRQLQSWEPKSVDVRLYGNVGMVTGLAEVKDVLRGDTRHFVVQYTHIWVKRNGAWQLVHRHTNRVSTIA